MPKASSQFHDLFTFNSDWFGLLSSGCEQVEKRNALFPYLLTPRVKMKWYYKCIASISLNSKTELYKRFNVYFNKSLAFIPNPMQFPLQQSCLLFWEVEEIDHYISLSEMSTILYRP